MINLTSTLFGTILGIVVKTIYDFYKYKNERKDKYMFVLLNKRFEVYQEANYYCEQLKKVVHDKTEKKSDIINNAREWFYKNNLYLSPSVREDFRRLILDVEFYGEQLNDFFKTQEDLGSDNEETIRKKEELKATWNKIMQGTQKKIQSDIDEYYEYLK